MSMLHLNIIEIYDAYLDSHKSSSNKPYRELELNEVIGSIAYQNQGTCRCFVNQMGIL